MVYNAIVTAVRGVEAATAMTSVDFVKVYDSVVTLIKRHPKFHAGMLADARYPRWLSQVGISTVVTCGDL
jgi:hypothetical protein